MNVPAPAIHSDAIGAELGCVARVVSKRNLLGYAAALDATEDVYLDDLRPGGIIGLPPFIVVPEWDIMNGQAYRQVLGLDDAGMWSCIHVQQDTNFSVPVVPGMTLTTRGQICEIRNTRIGCYVAVRLTSTIGEHGPLVAESWFGGIFLRRFAGGGNRRLAEAPVLPKYETPCGVQAQPLVTVTRGLAHLYTDAASIWNPIHTERSEARAAGLNDTLLHGTYTWARAGLYLIRLVANGDPLRLRRLGARMAGKALVGNELAIRCGTVSMSQEGVVVGFQVIDENNTEILAGGVAEFGP